MPSAPDFTTAHCLPALPNLAEVLRGLLNQIPPGRVTTYGTLAVALGDRLASRWVGHFLLHHDHDENCPCHRVVRADGSLGGYAAGEPGVKARRLRAEGIVVRRGIVDRSRYGFEGFRSPRPLAKLRQVQRAAAVKVRLEPPRSLPSTVAGLDVSYTAAGEGVAAYALVDFGTRELAWYTTIRRLVGFPYIQSFLTFRELPLLLAVLDSARQADRMADVLLVDGSGLVHQHQIGLASHLGVTVQLPTIGVTKSLLCGQVHLAHLDRGEARPIIDAGRMLGAAIKSSFPIEQVLFISPGNLVDLPFAVQVVRRLLSGHRLPEPLYWADYLSRQVARGKAPPRSMSGSGPGGWSRAEPRKPR